MNKIQYLTDEIIAKIAAGEVIERPSFAVKELIDNAIDAQADIVEIAIEDSGLTSISIRDNGVGMNKDDLTISFLPHTTSKIIDDTHPYGIKTLGFRGEALASIASISLLSIASRAKDAVGGTQVVVRDGKIEEINPVGIPVGTHVKVEQIFHSIPARKKFLKSAKTEFRHITEMVIAYALSYPTIHFRLSHNDKIVFDLPKKQQSTDRITTLLGDTLASQLFPVSYEDSYLQIRGFIGHPQVASKKAKQYLFINNRPVADRLLSLAVKESFGSLLPATTIPFYLLQISLPQEIVDVNVHPRKEHVAFVNAKDIFNAVKQAVSESLSENNITFRLAKFKDENSARTGETTSFTGSLLKKSLLSPATTVPLKAAKAEAVAQIDETYLISTTSEGIMIFDQHALHERIVFEAFSKSFLDEKNKNRTYSLPLPLTLTLSVTDAQIMDEYMELFQKIGFGIEPFHGTSFIIRSAPEIFKGRKLEKILIDMIDDVSVEGDVKTIDLRTKRMLAFLACRAATKAGDILTESQMKELITQFYTTKNNATCPHGRPTHTTVSLTDLRHIFQRKTS